MTTPTYAQDDPTVALKSAIEAARQRADKLEVALTELNKPAQPADDGESKAEAATAHVARMNEWLANSEAAPILSTITEVPRSL